MTAAINAVLDALVERLETARLDPAAEADALARLVVVWALTRWDGEEAAVNVVTVSDIIAVKLAKAQRRDSH